MFRAVNVGSLTKRIMQLIPFPFFSLFLFSLSFTFWVCLCIFWCMLWLCTMCKLYLLFRNFDSIWEIKDIRAKMLSGDDFIIVHGQQNCHLGSGRLLEYPWFPKLSRKILRIKFIETHKGKIMHTHTHTTYKLLCCSFIQVPKTSACGHFS